MNDIERMLENQMFESRFHRIMSDDFSFGDSLIEQSDIDKYEEDTENASDDEES